MWPLHQLIIAFLMVLAGSLNILSTKWADTLASPGIGGAKRKFTHPFLQCCAMFFGEMFFLLGSKYCKKSENADTLQAINSGSHNQARRGTKSFPRALFFLPAVLDWVAVSLMYVGLELTYASSFQMLRGAVVVFTGLFSIPLLNKRLSGYKWLGIFLIISGLVVVGLSDFSGGSGSAKSATRTNKMLVGDSLIVVAQVATAVQMVYEEKYITKYDIHPALVVGWEGAFGFLFSALLLVPLQFIPIPKSVAYNGRGVLEDVPDAFVQLYNDPVLATAFIGSVITVAIFRFAGVTVTKQHSATTRMVLDTVRTLVIWMVSLGIGWQLFSYLQIIGFSVFVVGMCLYNNLQPFKGFKYKEWKVFARRSQGAAMISRPGTSSCWETSPLIPK